MDERGKICAVSSQFTFCAPRPLDELVTLELEKSGEEGGDDLLVVVPKALILQVGHSSTEETRTNLTITQFFNYPS